MTTVRTIFAGLLGVVVFALLLVALPVLIVVVVVSLCAALGFLALLDAWEGWLRRRERARWSRRVRVVPGSRTIAMAPECARRLEYSSWIDEAGTERPL